MKNVVVVIIVILSILCVYYFYQYDKALKQAASVKNQVERTNSDLGEQVTEKQHIGQLEFEMPDDQWYSVSNLVDSKNEKVIGKVYRNYSHMSEAVVEERTKEYQKQLIKDCEDAGYDKQGKNPLIFVTPLRIEVFFHENGKWYGVSYKTFSREQNIAENVEHIINSRDYNKKLKYEGI